MAASLGRTRGFDQVYSLALQVQTLARLWPGMAFAPYRNPPGLALLIVPLTFLAPWPAYIAWDLLMGLAWLLSWHLLTAGGRRGRLIHLGLLLGSLPILESLMFGQPTGLFAIAMAGAWVCWRRGASLSAGLLTAVLLLKPQIGFAVPLLLLATGNRRALFGWALGAAAQVLLTVGLLGRGGITAGAAMLALATGGAADNSPLGGSPPQFSAIGALGLGPGAALLVALAAAAFVIVWRNRRHAPELAVPIGGLLSLVGAPFGHFYDVALVLPYAWMVIRWRSDAFHRVWFGLTWVIAFFTEGLGYPLLAVIGGWMVLQSLWPGQAPGGTLDPGERPDAGAELAAAGSGEAD